MQVFIKKNNIAAATPTVIAAYEDIPFLARDVHGSDCTVVTVPRGAIQYTGTSDGSIQLMSNWRSNASMIVNQEARRRILESFPDYMQSNASQDAISSSQKYGNDPAAWPADAKARRDAGQKGWDYISAVRQTSDTLIGALPADPTADTNWPARIPPVYI